MQILCEIFVFKNILNSISDLIIIKIKLYIDEDFSAKFIFLFNFLEIKSIIQNSFCIYRGKLRFVDIELGILARIVQSELDQYDPNISVDEYHIVKLPDSSIRQPILPHTEDIGNNENELITFTDDQTKIAVPVIELPENEVYEIDERTDEMPKARFQHNLK